MNGMSLRDQLTYGWCNHLVPILRFLQAIRANVNGPTSSIDDNDAFPTL